jgi:hypothetical protein
MLNGLLDPEAVDVPTEVQFGRKGSKKFAFAATFTGWHSGALVIDLEVRLPPSRSPRSDVTVITPRPGRRAAARNRLGGS